VKATTYYNDPEKLLEASEDLGDGHAGPRHLQAARRRADADPGLVRCQSKKRVGVLALQGDFEAHAKRALERAGATPVQVRTAEELNDIDGLVIPGGESTTMLKLLNYMDLMEPLRAFAREKPVFGTCAGAILLAKEVLNPAQESFGVVDLTVERNAYGRQIDSRVANISRAPIFSSARARATWKRFSSAPRSSGAPDPA
jgi:glutamine amidotransferase PdxT